MVMYIRNYDANVPNYQLDPKYLNKISNNSNERCRTKTIISRKNLTMRKTVI